MGLLTVLLGRCLANRENDSRKIGWFEAVPAMGLDGLESSSYGPDAALTVMIPLGAASLGWIGVVMAPIVSLLALLYFSYRQTVVAYPTNGGAYTVAKENLGRLASLLAAAAPAGRPAPRLVLLRATYREIHAPLLAYIDEIDAGTPGRAVLIMIPELVLTSPWQRLLHNRRAEHVRTMLLRYGGPRLTVVTAPWRR